MEYSPLVSRSDPRSLPHIGAKKLKTKSEQLETGDHQRVRKPKPFPTPNSRLEEAAPLELRFFNFVGGLFYDGNGDELTTG